MGLREVPCELFRMRDVKSLNLHINDLCSLPKEIAHMTKLTFFSVRRLKQYDRGLTKARFQVSFNQLTSLPPELGLLTNLTELYVRLSTQRIVL
jgi:Leucine-rich repeat (LRR) protein